MSIYYDIEQVLINAVAEMAAANSFLVDYPNAPIPTSSQSKIWLAVHNLRAETIIATMGLTGENDYRGVLQVDVNGAKGNGSGSLLKKVGIIVDNFPIGRILRYNGIKLRITKCSVSAGREVGNNYRISISINYSVRHARIN